MPRKTSLNSPRGARQRASSPTSGAAAGDARRPTARRRATAFVKTDAGDQGLGAAFQQNSLQRSRQAMKLRSHSMWSWVPRFKGKARTSSMRSREEKSQSDGRSHRCWPGRRAAGHSPSSTLWYDISAYRDSRRCRCKAANLHPKLHHDVLLRKIPLCMRSWQNYVFLEGHGHQYVARRRSHRMKPKAARPPDDARNM